VGVTQLVILFVTLVAMGVGVWGGWRRGPVVRIASIAGVVAAGALGYFAVLALTLPM
jgi:hypothetical protein